ncbi:MAG TPA: DUF2244 domain-containing protein [Rhizomicrobium sp.]|nr:DUF2244 domain-containing protein [Rhizomicrobium sp.]
MSTVSDPVYFKAVLRPNPPLPASLRNLLITVVAAFNLAFAIMFLLRGAWPVTPFMGADVLFLAWALSISSKAGNRREEVQVTRSKLRVDYYPPQANLTWVELNPYWVRIYVDEPLNGRTAVTLASHGRRLRIGAFLPPDDRLSLAQALRSALDNARQGA